MSEECLFALVVVVGIVLEVPGNSAVWPDGVALGAERHVFGVAERPSGKGAGRLFDVVFGVVAHAHAEEFQQFAPPVFVDSALVVVVVVQPDDHRGIA